MALDHPPVITAVFRKTDRAPSHRNGVHGVQRSRERDQRHAQQGERDARTAKTLGARRAQPQAGQRQTGAHQT